MDHYKFPRIEHIDQVKEAIKGREEFIIAERDRHTVVNYMVNSTSTFPRTIKFNEHMVFDNRGESWDDCPNWEWDETAAILRECRGLVFGPKGNVIARRFHKFFNVGEREEVFLEDVDFTRPHVIMDKLDGSMITPIPIYDDNGEYHVRWGTKMGLTAVAFPVEEYVAQHHEYIEMAIDMIESGQTPIFEWCTRKQRIVIDYPKDELRLVAIRDNITGQYMIYEDMFDYARVYGVLIAPKLPDDHISNPQQFVDWVKGLEGIEGFVIRFDDGHMLKVKCDWYCRIHRAKDSILQEKRMVEMLVNEKVDDVKPFLLHDDLKKVEAFESDFTTGLLHTAGNIFGIYNAAYKCHNGDKKDFAIKSDFPGEFSIYKSVIFSLWGSNPTLGDVVDELKKRIRKHLGSQTKVDQARWMWRNHKWVDYIQAQEE